MKLGGAGIKVKFCQNMDCGREGRLHSCPCRGPGASTVGSEDHKQKGVKGELRVRAVLWAALVTQSLEVLGELLWDLFNNNSSC